MKEVIKIENSNIKKDVYEISKGIFIFTNITAPYFIISNFLDSKYGNEKIYLGDLNILEASNFINDIGYTILFYHIYMGFKWIENN